MTLMSLVFYLTLDLHGFGGMEVVQHSFPSCDWFRPPSGAPSEQEAGSDLLVTD